MAPSRWRLSMPRPATACRDGSIALELLTRQGEATLLHAGVRYWIRREKLALDFSLQLLRAVGARENGAVIGIGWYDL